MANKMRQDVEIKTHDQVTLRGWFFPAGAKAPVVVMSPGLSGIKENYLDHFAARFQRAGIAVLLYDHRNWGASDGYPRHHTNHYEQVQDAHDVIGFLSTREDIDTSRIALWGSSFSGGIALVAGAVDPRIKVVICQVPFVSGITTRKNLSHDILSQIFTDRAQTTSLDPSYIPVFPDSLEQAQTQPHATVLGTEECWHHHQRVEANGTRKENKITLQSLFHAIRSEPIAFVPEISPKPLFMAVALQDSVIDPQWQLEAFERADEPKELHEFDCGHFDVYLGETFEKNISAQVSFLEKYL